MNYPMRSEVVHLRAVNRVKRVVIQSNLIKYNMMMAPLFTLREAEYLPL